AFLGFSGLAAFLGGKRFGARALGGGLGLGFLTGAARGGFSGTAFFVGAALLGLLESEQSALEHGLGLLQRLQRGVEKRLGVGDDGFRRGQEAIAQPLDFGNGCLHAAQFKVRLLRHFGAVDFVALGDRKRAFLGAQQVQHVGGDRE